MRNNQNTTDQPKARNHSENVLRDRQIRWRRQGLIYVFVPLAFFFCSFFFIECLLRAANSSISFFSFGLLRCLFSSLTLGAALWLLTTLLPWKKAGRVIAIAVLFLFGAFAIAECCVQDFFGTYYQVSYMLSMSGQVAGDFLSEAIDVVVKHLWFFPLALLPAILTIIFRSLAVPARSRINPQGWRQWLFQAAVLIAALLLNLLLCHVGEVQYYTTDYSANSAIPRYGMANTLELEIQYAIFGQPTLTLDQDETILTSSEETAEETDDSSEDTGSDSASSEEEDTGVESTEEEEGTDYEDNILDIDFDSLIASDTDETLLAMDEYFSSQTATEQNEYTGLFEGKNLIFITAEAFSYAVIDEERTPTLYMLANSGFVFSNYYQPNWTQSTTGGEFAAMTGLIPTWVNGETSFAASVGNSMPFGLGWVFQSLGYTTTAYHNNTYTYYDRNETHTNLGYDFIGIGNGLEIDSASSWPSSDLEMMEATLDEQIEAYLEDGTLFHTYYMTVSGHCNYGWDVNDMALKNQDAVSDLDYSETVLAYLACQQELEYALEYLVDALETAGIADDTVIVLTADHYPYALSEDSDVDYYVELTGIDDNENLTSRYQNTLIIWSGSMEEPVEVDTPCTAVDIVPTLLNLFGVEYDSRLLSGRDILASDVEVGEVDSSMHVAIFADYGYGNSWITAAGTYEAYTDTFTPADGVELEDEEAYVEAVTQLVQNRYSYAKYIVQEDYYSHVFPNWTGGMSLTEALSSTE